MRPGFTLTDRALTTPDLGQDAVDAESAKTPTLRICTPEDVAAVTAFLGSAANGTSTARRSRSRADGTSPGEAVASRSPGRPPRQLTS
ncbi:hypothetical protein [Allokutzneria sp. NRRL B-24872]|uniref:hypothetical protein n=1 Tax=Allokutzneria sp. NRRL B-24872 TaxID=1137961 RepID=UPI001AEF9C38|nr:hypothetical protein [Allokutzneria sp. NRRL B-24872]